MKITAVDSFVIDVPMVDPIPPYQSRYLASMSSGALLLRIETDAQITGWGEAPQRLAFQTVGPFTGNEAKELRPKLIGRDPTDIEALYHDWDLDGHYVQSGVEMACWDILGKLCGQPLYRLLGGAYRKEIALAACMGIRPPEDAAAISRGYVEAGFTTLKTKAGRDAAEDLAMVRAIRESVGDRLQLRIDPNTGYTPEECRKLAKQLEPYDLEYFEQPMPADALEASAAIRKETTTPLALNESVTTLDVVRRILDLDAAAYLLPDTQQCGGLRAVRQVADVAASAGIPCVFHCSHDFGLKTATMLHVSAATANFPLPNDCTYYGLAEDIIVEPHTIQEGRMRVPEAPGLGVDVDLEKVKKYLVAGTA